MLCNTFIHTHTLVHKYKYSSTQNPYTLKDIQTGRHTHTHTNTHKHKHKNTHTNTLTHIHTHTHTLTHTHKHTHSLCMIYQDRE